MEKKTLGTFLAALRKASGMTQKQLAEKLNVSDKAISRWERDECAPDLALIPVIAEIFGITADELLRGERRNPDSSQQEEKKTDRQLHSLLDRAKTKFKVQSITAFAVALVGLIAAMACDLGFLRAYLGFFIGTAFYLAAAVAETIFLIFALQAVNDTEFDGAALEAHRRRQIRTAALTFGGIAVLFAGTLPLILVPWDPYMGLDGGYWLMNGAICGGIAAGLSAFVYWLLQGKLQKTGFFTQTAEDAARGNLRKKVFRTASILLAIILVLQCGINLFTSATTYVRGETFETMEDFKACMETPATYEGGSFTIGYDAPFGSPDASMVYIGEDGSIIDPEEIPEETVTGKDGQILCTYTPLNRSVTEIHFGDPDDGMLPITVYTEADRIHGSIVLDNINAVFFLLYFVLAVSTIACYIIKSRKIR